ncbi:hypothetical protein F4806DRAFT_387088 [Annulohypoxylon nitens]|nr:hypothetical protein F4806DRAFT_387088 [Annulohypoxylon nitens]
MAYATPLNPNSLVQETRQLNRDSTVNLAIRHTVGDTEAEWDECMANDLESKLADEIYPYLWLVARKSGAHIDPLYLQLIKNRDIVITEDPKLHLVWYYGIIYIKPLPDYLLNYAIWQGHLPEPIAQATNARPRYDKYRAALGFLRSYSFLIRHESDFIIAQRNNLLPKYVSFQKFQVFIQPFRSIRDDQVAHRYQYGQLRLTRLNWLVHFIKIYQILSRHHTAYKLPWNYVETLWQTSQYIQKYAAPLVFVLLLLSLILSSMQVILAALGDKTWHSFVRVSWIFSVATIVFAASPAIVTIISIIVVLIVQGQFAVRMKWKTMKP